MKSISALVETEVSNTGLCPQSCCFILHWPLAFNWTVVGGREHFWNPDYSFRPMRYDQQHLHPGRHQGSNLDISLLPSRIKTISIKCIQMTHRFKNYFEVQIYKHNQITRRQNRHLSCLLRFTQTQQHGKPTPWTDGCPEDTDVTHLFRNPESR